MSLFTKYIGTYFNVASSSHPAGTASVEGREVRFLKKFIKFNHRVEYNQGGTSESRHHNLRLITCCVDASGDTTSTIERTVLSNYYYQDY